MDELWTAILTIAGAVKSGEWIFKWLYSRRRERKFEERIREHVTRAMRLEINDMELKLIDRMGAALEKRFAERIGKLETEMSYVKRQVNEIQVSHASIQRITADFSALFNKKIDKLHEQYKLILNAIRSRSQRR
jgi:hypothetical protein